jgi:hypothetical protein
VAWAVGAALAGALALTAEMSALQRIAATRVAPVVVAGQVLIPVIAGPLAFDESWAATPLGGALLAFGVLVVAGGAALLGASPALADVIAQVEGVGGGGGGDAGGGPGGRRDPDPASEQVEHDVGGERQAGVPRDG